jgi:hypothetical protein
MEDCQLYHHGLVASSTGNQRLLEMLRVEDLAWKPVMIFGLVNNFAHKYRQCDNTPYRVNGTFHMAGDVMVVSNVVFMKTADMPSHSMLI